MKLLEEVKKLRASFPELKIRQRLDSCNRRYAEMVLPNCRDYPKIIFEYDYILLDFCGSCSMYGYREDEFDYLISELKSLMSGATVTAVYEYEEKFLGAEILNSNKIDHNTICGSVRKFNDWELPDKPLTVKLRHFDADMDRTFILDTSGYSDEI